MSINRMSILIILCLVFFCNCRDISVFYAENPTVSIKNINLANGIKNVTYEINGVNFNLNTEVAISSCCYFNRSDCIEDKSYVNNVIYDVSFGVIKGIASFSTTYRTKNQSVLCIKLTENETDKYWKELPFDIGLESTNESKEQDVVRWKRASHHKRSAAPLRIIGLRVEHSHREVSLSPTGVPELLASTETILRLFGTGLTENTVITFTHDAGEFGGHCLYPASLPFLLEKGSVTNISARVAVTIPEGKTFYLCAKQISLYNSDSVTYEEALNDSARFIHQGSEEYLQINTYQKLLPLWASVLIILFCLTFSALFSGLNLGLMSMDRTDLKILCNTGTENEKRYARIVQPVRDHGNFLLCSILLGNVLVNSTFTILLDDLTSGLVAVICSTLAIVVFGEITPQAICSRHGLAVGARTIYITKAVMVLTFPLSYPTSKILDWLLGEEIGNVYNRERLKELVKVTTDINDLDKDEVNIISGALELRKKLVSDVMTRIDDAFMLDYEAHLDFETVSEIMKSGFSRIPVYEGDRSNIVTVLYIKDLAFVDPDDNTPLKTLSQFYQNPCNFVFEDVTLDVLFKQFKEGNKGHMAFVHRVNNEGEGDPFYETIGLVTLEDVIEELIQSEIMDETDVFTDNRNKRKRDQIRGHKQDFTVFAERRENQQRMRISPQLTLATFQYLSTSVDAFKPDQVSETILRRLLKQDVVHIIKNKAKDKEQLTIYQQGHPVDFFVLVLEGRVEVTVGKENLVFESGPFTYFGLQALAPSIVTTGVPESVGAVTPVVGSLESLNMDVVLKHAFVPDYTVRAVSDVIYVAISRALYLTARRATLMERASLQQGGPAASASSAKDAVDRFDDEVEKLLRSLDEDDESDDQQQNNRLSEEYCANELPMDGPGPILGPVSASPFTRASFNSAPAVEDTCSEPTDMLLPKQNNDVTAAIKS